MNVLYRSSDSNSQRGQALVEFAMVAVFLVFTLLGVLEMCRVVLVYTSVANAAKTGVRYAIVHGANSPVTTTQVQDVVKNFMKAAPLNLSNPGLSIPVSYPDSGCKSPGCRVEVSVVYPYDPLVGYFPLSITLRSKSQGVITF